MGIKNMFKKSSKILDREGFYIILFVCLCIVAVTAVYISRNNANTARRNAEAQKQVEQQQQQQPSSSGTQLVEEKQNPATPTMQQPDKTASTKSSTTAKNTTTKSSTPAKSAVSSVSLKLEMPVAGEVGKTFDKENLQYSETMQQWETHEGLDITCDMGSEVMAAASGKVADVVNDDVLTPGVKSGYGVKVIIDHGNGLRTAYCNLDTNVKVKKGDTVKKGQVIGTVGETAVREAVAVEGSHLHFVVLKKSGNEYTTVDPQDFLK